MRWQVQPLDKVAGTLQPPGDKSISHRAVMFAALANGTSVISDPLMGADNLATVTAFGQLGVSIDVQDHQWRVQGVGKQGLKQPLEPLDMGNSGTAMRLMAGLLAGQKFTSRLIGDASLSRRPMRRILTPLHQMGADITATAVDTAPLTIRPAASLQGITYRPEVASAQVKSCVLLAGLYAAGETSVEEPGPSRDHTERMLPAFGVDVQVQGRSVSIQAPFEIRPHDVQVPGDISSAAFWVALGLLHAQQPFTLENVGVNPTRTGFLDIVQRMGGDVVLENTRQVAGEPVADIVVRKSRLQHVEVDGDDVVRAIDEFPVLFALGCFAKGGFTVRNAQELRHKETDRIAVMCQALNALGVETEAFLDGAHIQQCQTFKNAVVDACDDHRCAMALAILGSTLEQPLTIDACAAVATSYPGFVAHAGALGWTIEEQPCPQAA